MENFNNVPSTGTFGESIAVVNENFLLAQQKMEELQALYNALLQTEHEIIEPSDTWPVANPEEGVIYRVIDRVNTPPQYYSDYMWNGTSMVQMAQYNNAIDDEPTPGSNNLVKSGGVAANIVYDISAAHSGTTYADLASALGTNGANVPVAVRKGGMSIKYVQSSDNKYVQARCMAQNFTTDVTQWQGSAIEITAGSKDLSESNAVFSFQNKYSSIINSKFNAIPIYNKNLTNEELVYYSYLVKSGTTYRITINGVNSGRTIVGSNNSRQAGYLETFIETQEDGCYIYKVSSNAEYFKLYSSSTGTVNVLIEEIITKDEFDLTSLNTLFVNKTVLNIPLYKDLSYIKSDIVFIKITNVPNNSKVYAGFVDSIGDSGFTDKLLEVEGSINNEYVLRYNIKDSDSKVLKIFTSVSNAQVEVQNNPEQYNVSYPLFRTALTANQTLYQDVSQVEIGKKGIIRIKCKNNDAIELGFVSSVGEAGFVNKIFNGIATKNEYVIVFEAAQGQQILKAYTTASEVLVEVYNVFNDATEIALLSTCYSLGVINTANSYIRNEILKDDYFLIKLRNVPIGANIMLGTHLSSGGAGFTEIFSDIQNAESDKYDIVCKASQQANFFKLWASQSNINYEIWTNKSLVSATGDLTGYVVVGKDCYGGKQNFCVAIGSKTLENNTGVKNISIGNDNMRDCSGHDNTSMGYHSAFRLTSGIYNAAFGAESQDDVTSGNNNTSLGFCSLQRNNTGSNNVAVGCFALDGVYDDRFDEQDQKGWSDNVAVGADAMRDAVRGSDDNVAIGKGALGSNKTYTNCIAIGKNADCTKNNQMVLGSSSITEVVVMGNKKLIFNQDGSVTWETLS